MPGVTMNDPELQRRTPHVDPAWVDAFVLELRLRGASGAEIGGALLEVESHMAEQGGEVAEVFGDPKDYAIHLELPDSQRWTTGEVIRLGVKVLLGVLGAYLFLGGLLAFGDPVQVPVTGLAVLPGGNLAVLLALVAWGDGLVRVLVERPVISIGLFAAAFTLLVVGSVVVGGPQLEVSGAAAILLGLVAFALTAAIWLSERRTGRSLEDPVSFPGH